METPGYFSFGKRPGQVKVPPGIKADRFTPLPGSRPVPLLEAVGCMWPVGESPWLFCNQERAEKPKRSPGAPTTYHSFCPHHQAQSLASKRYSK